MTAKIEAKKEIHYRCKKCGDEIYWNTHKSMTYCKCKALGVDGCEFTPLDTQLSNGVNVRLIGNEADREEIRKERKQ